MGKANKYAIRRVVVSFFLLLYLLVAALNSTIVQSYLGAVVSDYFSKEWGGKVRIGALHASPFSHVILDKIELISPTNDTIYYGDRITCRFKEFPFNGSGLHFRSVYLRNGRYHLHTFRYPDGKSGINLNFIIDYYAARSTPDTTPATQVFTVDVDELRLHNISYIQDLPEPEHPRLYAHGVVIPHMRYWNTSGVLRNIHVANDHVKTRVVSLTTTEESGLHIVDLSMDAEVSPNGISATNIDLQTDDSRVFMDARLDFNGWEEMSDYCNTIFHDVTIKEGTEVNLRDAAFWAPILWGTNVKIATQGHIYGTIADLNAQNLLCQFGESSRLFLDADIKGLPFIEKTTLNAVLHRLHTNHDDLAAIQLPESVHFTLPDITRRMAVIDLSAEAHGGMHDLEAWANLNSLIGDLEAHAHLIYDTSLLQYTWLGDIDSRNIGVAPLLPNPWVSRTGLHLSFQGSGTSLPALSANVEGRLYNTRLRGNNIGRTWLSADINHGEFNADFGVRDSLIDLDINAYGNLNDSSYHADARLNHARLSDLGLLHSSQPVTLSTHLQATLSGQDPENLSADASFRNTLLELGERSVALQNIVLQAVSQEQSKHIVAGCDWLTLNLDGQFPFAHLPLMVQDFCRRFLPAYINPYLDNPETSDTPSNSDIAAQAANPLAPDNFHFEMLWNDPQGSFADLMPNILIADGTHILGNYNGSESLKLILTSDSLNYGTIQLRDLGLDATPLGETYRLILRATTLRSGPINILDNLNLTTTLTPSLSTLALRWDDNAATLANQGDLEFFLTSTRDDNRIMITKPHFYVVGQEWSIVCTDGIRFNQQRLQFDNLRIYGMTANPGSNSISSCSVALNALISGSDHDHVDARFDDFPIGQLATLLLASQPVAIQGTLQGTVQAKDFKSDTRLDANLQVEDCMVNHQSLGTLNINTQYQTDQAKLLADVVAVNGNLTPLQLHGYLLTSSRNNEINFDLDADHLPLQIAQPILQQAVDELQGTLKAHIHAEGPLNSPRLQGSLALLQSRLKLKSTGVTYFVNDSVKVDGLGLQLNNFSITDNEQNRALLNGTIDLNNGTTLDLNLNTDRLKILDLPASDQSFYGKLIASANGHVSGPIQRLQVAVEATSQQGSELFVPISNRKEISENEFIVFIQPQITPRRLTPSRQALPSQRLNLQANVTVTPDVTLHLPMDFDQLTAQVTAVGRGDIQVTMRGSNEPNILGNYEFTHGNLSLSLIQLINKNFAIEEGSTLNFPGNINDARFNINAVYNQRVNLATLTSDATDTYVQVQDVISLAGTLQQPSIRFDIRLPNAEQSVSEQVFSYIDKNNERDLLNQSISILLMGRFAPVGTEQSALNPLGDGGSINLLTSSASSLVSNLVKVVDVDFKYQAATGTTAGKFDVGISKQWNKLYFESTFGYGNTNSQMENTSGNVLVGDVEVGYRFNPTFNFYGFHRSNTSFYTRTELPYKQGIGIKLTKDFDSFYDLFPWLRRRSLLKPSDSPLGKQR